MKKTTTIITTLTVLLLGCSDKDNRVTVQDTFGNGQPKSTTFKTIDDKNTYYEIKYDSLGRLKEITPYSDGQINGTIIYFRNDNLGVAALLPHKDGKREGFTYEFYEGQQTLFKGESKDGEFNGLSTWFHKDGRPEETGVRTNGKKEGEWTEYYENGQIKGKGTYLNGSKQNDWTYWNNDGTIDTTQHD